MRRTKRRTAGLLLTAAALCLTACSTTGSPKAASGPTGPTGAADKSTSTQAGTPGDGCPLAASDLSTATGKAFDLAETRKDHALETLPDVKALVCVFTSTATPQEAGDPLVLRVDTVTGANAAVVRSNFERSCTDNGGALGESTVTNGRTCARGDNIVEGNITTGDRSVEVYFVNATNDTAAALTEVFDKVLASVS